jgi:hypothetical protein
VQSCLKTTTGYLKQFRLPEAVAVENGFALYRQYSEEEARFTLIDPSHIEALAQQRSCLLHSLWRKWGSLLGHSRCRFDHEEAAPGS